MSDQPTKKKKKKKKKEQQKNEEEKMSAAKSASTERLSSDEALTLHRALHIPGATSTPSLRGGVIPAATIERKSATKLRFVRLPPPFALEIVEQNPTKVSKWAKLASTGFERDFRVCGVND
jgi:hypothetical protein